jgi:hypothetical protein
MTVKPLPDLTPEQRQANIDRMINAWKERKQKLQEETLKEYDTPEFQAILTELRERNAARKTA